MPSGDEELEVGLEELLVDFLDARWRRRLASYIRRASHLSLEVREAALAGLERR